MNQVFVSFWKFFFNHMFVIVVSAVSLVLLVVFLVLWDENRKLRELDLSSSTGDSHAIFVCRYPRFQSTLEEYQIYLLHDVESAYVSNDPNLTRRFRRQRRIESLTLTGELMTPDVLRNFSQSRDLKTLRLGDIKWSGNNSLELFPEAEGMFQKLELLEFYTAQVSYETLWLLSQSANLACAHIHEVTIDGNFQAKKYFPHVNHIRTTSVTGEIFAMISGADKMTYLEIQDCQPDVENLPLLLEFKNLKTVELSGDYLTDELIEHLAQKADCSECNQLAGSLRDLTLSSEHLTVKSVDVVEQLFPQLEKFVFVSPNISVRDFYQYNTRDKNTLVITPNLEDYSDTLIEFKKLDHMGRIKLLAPLVMSMSM